MRLVSQLKVVLWIFKGLHHRGVVVKNFYYACFFPRLVKYL